MPEPLREPPTLRAGMARTRPPTSPPSAAFGGAAMTPTPDPEDSAGPSEETKRGMLTDYQWNRLAVVLEQADPEMWRRLIQHDTLRDTRERKLEAEIRKLTAD